MGPAFKLDSKMIEDGLYVVMSFINVGKFAITGF
jgi:hypothetical protein